MTAEAAAFAVRLLQLQPDNFVFTSMISLADSALELAVSLEHPIYDCLFIALAVRERCPFITSDEKLLRKVANKELPVISMEEALITNVR